MLKNRFDHLIKRDFFVFGLNDTLWGESPTICRPKTVQFKCPIINILYMTRWPLSSHVTCHGGHFHRHNTSPRSHHHRCHHDFIAIINVILIICRIIGLFQIFLIGTRWFMITLSRSFFLGKSHNEFAFQLFGKSLILRISIFVADQSN